ncbi:flagella assembly protein FlgT [Gilvimarinus agarilyticus]|uniref:flagellar assembly protein T N-terminal domain-containing protein n=1 Tax=unclassified Gilvimarinus TaxID=2642066 RepID=UPI001C080C93|nr:MULTISPECIES: flagellar assembly protein T N-terminal domain-containing protein [unclassified Gilvimarinus]MBU2887839.1 flagella assembly protein FlgT [Gilvimarinus agarilyticus]MDO6572477.1 flagellar assembly protein T N-terminal domain-containing protein [Gilvimarinus sp. 2_MG-2023]MDO6746617.1 flagellar assembly protein T N-terminal domain-containing protein [Gilvimarinus sp. 1_MG-2023]
MHRFKTLALLATLSWSLIIVPAAATTITAQGRSALSEGSLSEVRQRAIEDAARTALMQAGLQVNASTVVVNAAEVDDQIRVSTKGQLKALKVIGESQKDGIYQVTVSAELAPQAINTCPSSDYQKSLLVTAFNVKSPTHSRVGELNNADTALSSAMAERLYPNHQLQVQTQPELLLASTNRLMSNHYELFNAVQQVANQYQAQYVMTGYIEDMSMVNGHGYYRSNSLGRASNRVASTVKGWVGQSRDDIRARHFRFRLMLHDGVTGARIFDKSYATQGLWTADYTARTGFASPEFWSTDYGHKTSELIDQAVADIGQKALCQPFMAPLKVSAHDQNVYLLAGANNGVDVGDSFTVYAQGAAPFANIQYYGTQALAPTTYKRLDQTEVTLTITQTYPGYSVGRFDGVLQPYLQYMAMAEPVTDDAFRH